MAWEPLESGASRRLTPDEANQIATFNRLRSDCHRRWREKIAKHGNSGEFDESAEDWLFRTAYRHLRRIVADGNGAMFEYLVERERSLKKGRHSIRGKPFKVGLIAILGDRIKLLRNRRTELSDAMEYAYIHSVPSKYFNGFVKQAGQKRIAKKLAEGAREPGFNPKRMIARP